MGRVSGGVRGSLAFVWVVCACGDGDGSGGGFSNVRGVPEVQSYGAVWSFAADDVYVTAEAGRVLHYDGSEWDEIQLETSAMMLGIWGFGPRNIWMVGGSSLARFDGDSWTVTDLREESPGLEGLTAIWGSAPDDVWVTGTQSTAGHFDGDSWRRHVVAGTENGAVWGSGSDDVYVLGNFDMAHWDGSAFSELDLDIFSGAGVWGFGAGDVWIVDGSEEVAHFDGDDWEVTELDLFAGPSAIWGLAPDDLWGVGDFGSVTHYDGQRWREVTSQAIGSPFLRIFTKVHGSPDGDVWIVGSELGDDGVKPLLMRR